MGLEVLIPLAGIFCLFGLPVLAFVFFRMLAHRERMEMIRNGLTPDSVPKQWRASPAAPSMRASSCGDDNVSVDNPQPVLRKGITLTFIGFALTLGLSFIGYDDNKWTPGPWLLGGLVPMFVGLAQVTIAVISGATLGALRPGAGQTFYSGTPSPPQPPQPPPAGAVNFDSSYTYRPGSTQELRPPSSPPERRS